MTEATLEQLRFWIPIGSLVLALLSAAAAVVSARASKKSADQAQRSADVAVSSYKLQVRPYVVPVVGTKSVPHMTPPPQTEVLNVLYLENRGTGVAHEISAELNIAHTGSGAETPHSHKLAAPALRPGDREEVGPVGSRTGLDVWGRISFYNAEEERIVLECSRGEKTWRKVED